MDGFVTNIIYWKLMKNVGYSRGTCGMLLAAKFGWVNQLCHKSCHRESIKMLMCFRICNTTNQQWLQIYEESKIFFDVNVILLHHFAFVLSIIKYYLWLRMGNPTAPKIGGPSPIIGSIQICHVQWLLFFFVTILNSLLSLSLHCCLLM